MDIVETTLDLDEIGKWSMEIMQRFKADHPPMLVFVAALCLTANALMADKLTTPEEDAQAVKDMMESLTARWAQGGMN